MEVTVLLKLELRKLRNIQSLLVVDLLEVKMESVPYQEDGWEVGTWEDARNTVGNNASGHSGETGEGGSKVASSTVHWIIMSSKSKERISSTHSNLSSLSSPFLVPLSSRKYGRQFASIYDYRLRFLRNRIKPRAINKWQKNGTATNNTLNISQSQNQSRSDPEGENENEGREGEGEGMEAEEVDFSQEAKQVERILEIKRGKICWIVGTLYLSMHLKPDVLEDLTREVSRLLACFFITHSLRSPFASFSLFHSCNCASFGL